MPTPFQHLVYAKRVLESPALPARIRAHLQAAPGAYLLGNTAVDVQSITGQSRYTTHFYHLPPTISPRASEVMLQTYPELADPGALSPAHAAFISGYLSHLAWDEIWAWDVFMPFFSRSSVWSDRLTRLTHHNALRVTMDRQAEATLRQWSYVETMRDVKIRGWLRFVEDEGLRRWRDWVVRQLEAPDAVETTRVFAERLGISVAQLDAVIHDVSSEGYETPRPGLHAAIERFETRAVTDSISHLLWYWRCQDREVETKPFQFATCNA